MDFYPYIITDKAISHMNRFLTERFSHFPLDADEIHMLSSAQSLYSECDTHARQVFRRIYDSVYDDLYLFLSSKTADFVSAPANLPKERLSPSPRIAESSIPLTIISIDELLSSYNRISLYIYTHEIERKEGRFVESVISADDKKKQVNDSLRLLSYQMSTYAFEVTDLAVRNAFISSGVKYVLWVSEKDDRVCGVCHTYDGKIYLLGTEPLKPHPNCRCHLEPVFKPDS